MIKFLFGLLANVVLSMIVCGVWLAFGKIFTSGDYTMNYWATVQAWFWILFAVDIIYSLYKLGQKI